MEKEPIKMVPKKEAQKLNQEELEFIAMSGNVKQMMDASSAVNEKKEEIRTWMTSNLNFYVKIRKFEGDPIIKRRVIIGIGEELSEEQMAEKFFEPLDTEKDPNEWQASRDKVLIVKSMITTMVEFVTTIIQIRDPDIQKMCFMSSTTNYDESADDFLETITLMENIIKSKIEAVFSKEELELLITKFFL